MNIKSLQAFCLSLPDVTKELRWGQDLCFFVDGEMFCFADADSDGGVSFKVPEESLEQLLETEGVIPAPYLERENWVLVLDFSRLEASELEFRLRQSYHLVAKKPA